MWMTYRGVYRDGFVRLQGDVHLPNGSYVEVNPALEQRAWKAPGGFRRSRSSRNRGATDWELATRKKLTRPQRVAAALAACGTWKDRPEWKGKSSARIAAMLRGRAARRGRNG